MPRPHVKLKFWLVLARKSPKIAVKFFRGVLFHIETNVSLLYSLPARLTNNFCGKGISSLI